jgi:hypothetical protein
MVRRCEDLGEGDRGWILNGLRGVGKTVLLNELLRRVGERDWITAKVEAGACTRLRATRDPLSPCGISASGFVEARVDDDPAF